MYIKLSRPLEAEIKNAYNQNDFEKQKNLSFYDRRIIPLYAPKNINLKNNNTYIKK